MWMQKYFYKIFKKFCLQEKPPQKVAYLWQLGGFFFLCSPAYPKQPRTSFLFSFIQPYLLQSLASDNGNLLNTLLDFFRWRVTENSKDNHLNPNLFIFSSTLLLFREGNWFITKITKLELSVRIRAQIERKNSTPFWNVEF